MRVRLSGVRPAWLASVFTIPCLLFACAEAQETREPLPSAAEVGRANTAPSIVSIALEPAEPEPGASVRAVVEVHDDDGDPVKMTYEWTLDGEPVGSGLAKLALRDASRDSRLEVTVVASDGRDDSEPATTWAHLANRLPRVERLLIGPALEITAGTDVEVTPQAQDEDGDALEFRYAWTVNGEPTPEEGALFHTGALQKGDVLTVEVRAHDGKGAGEALASPPIQVVNLPPRVVSRPGPSAPHQGFRYQVEAEDPDGDGPLRFELEDAPDGMQIDAASGEVTWTPWPDQGGTHRVRVVVDDQHGGRIEHAFEVAVGGALAPPASEGR